MPIVKYNTKNLNSALFLTFGRYALNLDSNDGGAVCGALNRIVSRLYVLRRIFFYQPP